ncbi:g10862 [Coccomyxa elongata]
MARFLNTLERVSSLFERLNEASRGDDPKASFDAFRDVHKVAKEFAFIRPVLEALILHTRGTLREDNASPCRQHSAPQLQGPTASQDRPLLTSHYQDYVEAGVNPVEAFALMSDPAASAYFDNVLACGIQRGADCCMAGELLVKHIWYTGLQLHMSENKLTPLLLSKLAAYASGKAESLKAVIKVLPELCQGVSPDDLLQRVVLAKTEIRKGLLRRYMQALDESEGLQGITTRLSQRLGVNLDSLHSETTLDIPWHVRQYLQKYERCTDDRKLLASMEMQIVVLRAIGAQEAPSEEDTFDTSNSVFAQRVKPFRLGNTLPPTGTNSDLIKAQTKSALQKYNSSPCTFGVDGLPQTP